MASRPNDEDILKMGVVLKNLPLPYTPMVTKCLLIGRHCTAVHIVDVIPLYPLAVPKTHRDLDFFMWSRGLPHYADNYVDLHSGRVLLNFKKLGDMKRYKADYIVVHFDQTDSDLFLAAQKQNRAMESMVLEEHPLWHGDMFVVKHDLETGRMVDVLQDDIGDIAELISEGIYASRLV